MLDPGGPGATLRGGEWRAEVRPARSFLRGVVPPREKARVRSGLTPRQASVARRTASPRPEGGFLHGFPEPQAPRFRRGHSVLPTEMTDPRWPGSDGWVKMSQNIRAIEIHYVSNIYTGAVDDFKFK